MKQSRERKRFTFQEKHLILLELDRGAKRADLEVKHGISHGTLSGFIKDRKKIEEAVSCSYTVKSKSSKQGKFVEVDTALLEWFRQIRDANERVTGSDLLEKALIIGEKLKERGTLFVLWKDHCVSILALLCDSLMSSAVFIEVQGTEIHPVNRRRSRKCYQ